MNDTAALIAAENIGKAHGLRPVLRGASLALRAGDFAVLTGANGSGKTTLLRLLALLGKPDTGTVRVLGLDPVTHASRCKAALGVVLHQTMIYPELSAEQNLALQARLHGMTDVNVSVENALERVGLSARAHDAVRTFSRGMQQRLALARALLPSPKVLLLDEPFTGLDEAAGDMMNRVLREFAAHGGCLLLSTHELQRGLVGCNRMLRLDQGRIHEETKVKT